MRGKGFAYIIFRDSFWRSGEGGIGLEEGKGRTERIRGNHVIKSYAAPRWDLNESLEAVFRPVFTNFHEFTYRKYKMGNYFSFIETLNTRK